MTKLVSTLMNTVEHLAALELVANESEAKR